MGSFRSAGFESMSGSRIEMGRNLSVPLFEDFFTVAQTVFGSLREDWEFECEQSVSGREASYLLTKNSRVTLHLYFEPFSVPWMQVVASRDLGKGVLRSSFESLARARGYRMNVDLGSAEWGRGQIEKHLYRHLEILESGFCDLLAAERGIGDTLSDELRRARS